MDKELRNMQEAAAEVESGKRPHRIGMPRNHSPWQELSQDEQVLQESAREVGAEDTNPVRKSPSGSILDEAAAEVDRERKPGPFDERFKRLDRRFEKLDETLERYRETSEEISNEKLDAEMRAWGLI